MAADRRTGPALALVMALAGPGLATAAEPKAVGREVVRIVAEGFYDRARGDEWATAHLGYADKTADARAFTLATDAALAELKASHTRRYTPSEVEYYGLLAIFAPALKRAPTAYDGIGVDLDSGRFVRRVFAGSPAEVGGLRRGDEILGADHKPFHPISSFRGQAGRVVALDVRRRKEGPLLEVHVRPRTIVPTREWSEAQDRGARLVDRGGKSIAYVPFFSGAGEDPKAQLRDQLAGPLRSADALVLDFRDGWGGCDPDFVDLFDSHPPVLTFVERDGSRRTYDPTWHKPLVLLINGGTRSGKEAVAHSIKTRRLGTLVGQRTAGAVLAGRPFVLSDGSLLLLAVADMLVDNQRLEGVGVAPDVEVADALPLANGADPQLDAALDVAAKAASAK